MLNFRKGNLVTALLEGDVDVLLHQANCQNTMGSGIAKEIKERAPGAYLSDTLYHRFCKRNHKSMLGTYSSSRVKSKSIVINLYGQDFYSNREIGQPDTQYWALFKALSAIKDKLKGKRVGIPKRIGCGLGGGDWDLVLHFLVVEYGDLDVYIYEYDPTEEENQ